MAITVEDRRRWANFAYRIGYRDPDAPCPYKLGSPSANAWALGREARLQGKPQALPFPKEG